MASTGEFTFGSGPTMRANCTATCRRDGGTVIVDCQVAMRGEYSSAYIGTGNVIDVHASGSAGGSGSATIHGNGDVWNGTGWHYASFSFSYANADAHSFTVSFSATSNMSSAGKFDGRNVSLSIDRYNTDSTIFIGCNSSFYMEFMCKTPYTFPTWSNPGGQDDIQWVGVGGGSWDRGGIHYEYAAGHTHTGASVNDLMFTDIYIGNTYYGHFSYYPRIVINYNANGGSSTPGAQEKMIGGVINLANAISRTHYTFLGWSTDKNTANAQFSAGKRLPEEAWNSLESSFSTNNGWREYMPAHNNNQITLYAIWRGNTYKIAYNANGGSSTPATQEVIYPNSVSLRPAISRNNGSTAGYKVTYNANGGSNAPAAQTSGNRAIIYTFDKWADGSATGTKYAAGASISPSSNKTMYATWTSSTSNNSSWTCSSTKPTKANFEFVGWSTSSGDTVAKYEPGKTYTITSALTLYAVWRKQATSIYFKDSSIHKYTKILYKDGTSWKNIKIKNK